MQVIGVAAVYYAGTYLAVLTSPLGLPVTSLWVSAGIAVASLLIFDIRLWPGIYVGSFLSNINAVPPPEALMVAFGNTLAPVCAYLLLRRVGFRIDLDRFKGALSFVLLGAFAAMTPSATVGVAALVIADAWPAQEYLRTWIVWWSSDVLGVLAVTPLLLVLRKVPRSVRGRFWTFAGVRWWRWLELTGLLLVTAAFSIVGDRTFGVLFLAFPLVVLAALRFQLNGVAPCTLIISAVAINTAAQGYGLFDDRGLYENVMILQVFNGTVVLTGLMLAVVITEWRQAREDIQSTCFRLAEVVERLQESMLPASEAYKDVQKSAKQAAAESRTSTGEPPSPDRRSRPGWRNRHPPVARKRRHR